MFLLLLIFGAIVFYVLIVIGIKLTGAVILACLWLFLCLPLGLIITLLGLILCCTIILVPVGIAVIKFGIRMMLMRF